ncbi:MX1 [Cervus elaphus hippelaphus]|uniref:Interferon-induced GTP-binding protein Mx1 n=1 Tax=Cervus elaphus hippelaphus TaxID=46360 RepID=A0A212CJE0_CEREH|nr:MX1 [Cervus elaphus hippelaphus]
MESCFRQLVQRDAMCRAGAESKSNLYSQYEEKVRPCIDLIDSLRALGVEQDLALPAIAVIGDQSSGKSSIAIAGEGMGISHELISLEVSSPHVPDLTLIDLPGITRVAVGNQPLDIEYQIKSLIRKYILRQETINLVVVPANSLWVAGILTKPDLVDKGTEDKVVDVVRNLVFHLKKGYMIVKCRGQQDIQNRLSLAKALQREQAFFEDHTHFRYVHGAFSGRTKVKDLLPHGRNACCPRSAVESIRVCPFHYCNRGESAWKSEGGIHKSWVLPARLDISVFLSPDIIRNTFTDVSGKHFSEFFNLHRTAKSKIEDIRLEKEEEAEKSIRLHFQMEQLVYCQDQVYRRALQQVREKEAEEEKKQKSNHFQQTQPSEPSAAEIFQHLTAYHQVSLLVSGQELLEEGRATVPCLAERLTSDLIMHICEVSTRISSHIPLTIQFFMLRTYGEQLKKSMLQLLQDKDQYDWLLKERTDTREKRKFLKERLERLSRARQRLAKFPG